jgi:hypothetical protein
MRYFSILSESAPLFEDCKIVQANTHKEAAEKACGKKVRQIKKHEWHDISTWACDEDGRCYNDYRMRNFFKIL